MSPLTAPLMQQSVPEADWHVARVQLEQVSRQLEDRPHQRVEERVFPSCARLRQVREKWADRFLRMSSHGTTGRLSPPSLRAEGGVRHRHGGPWDIPPRDN